MPVRIWCGTGRPSRKSCATGLLLFGGVLAPPHAEVHRVYRGLTVGLEISRARAYADLAELLAEDVGPVIRALHPEVEGALRGAPEPQAVFSP